MVWSSIGLTGGSTYLTAVVFRVHNSSGQALLRVPYRVEVLGPEGPLYVSSGQDSFSLSSGATRVVVWDGSVDRTQPTSARVTLYTPMPATTSANMQLTAIDQSKVEYSHLGINCSGLVECQLTGDLTWHGDQPVLPSSVAAVVHKGADTKGPIIAAGHGPLQFNLGQMLQPGQTAPFSISLAGNQARPDGPGDQSVIRAGVTTELVLD